MRLGASDISGSVTTFDPTNSSSGFAWNDIVRPANDTSTYRSDHFVVFRLSLPGTDIPSGSTSNPVLILQPGFQMRLEYQSPNGQWYPYSFLQGNNETTTTIGNTNPSSPTNLCLATTFSTVRSTRRLHKSNCRELRRGDTLERCYWCLGARAYVCEVRSEKHPIQQPYWRYQSRESTDDFQFGGHYRINLAESICHATANDTLWVSHSNTNPESQPSNAW